MLRKGIVLNIYCNVTLYFFDTKLDVPLNFSRCFFFFSPCISNPKATLASQPNPALGEGQGSSRASNPKLKKGAPNFDILDLDNLFSMHNYFI